MRQSSPLRNMVKWPLGPARATGQPQPAAPEIQREMNDLSQPELRSNTVREALAAINHAFVVYDAQERFVFCNARHREWYAPIADLCVLLRAPTEPL